MVSILREIIILLDFLSLCLGPSNFADLITALTTYTGACSASKPQFWYTNLQFCQSQYNSEGMKIVQSWPRPSKIWSNNDHFTTGGFIVKLKIQWMQWHFLQPVELCLFSWMMSALNVWFSVFDFVHTGLQGLLPDHFRKFPVHANSAYTCSSPNIKENEAAICRAINKTILKPFIMQNVVLSVQHSYLTLSGHLCPQAILNFRIHYRTKKFLAVVLVNVQFNSCFCCH